MIQRTFQATINSREYGIRPAEIIATRFKEDISVIIRAKIDPRSPRFDLLVSSNGSTIKEVLCRTALSIHPKLPRR